MCNLGLRAHLHYYFSAGWLAHSFFSTIFFFYFYSASYIFISRCFFF